MSQELLEQLVVCERVFRDLDDEQSAPRERLERRARIACAADRIAKADLELVDDRRVFEKTAIRFTETVEDFAREIIEEETSRFLVAGREGGATLACVLTGAAGSDEGEPSGPTFRTGDEPIRSGRRVVALRALEKRPCFAFVECEVGRAERDE